MSRSPSSLTLRRAALTGLVALSLAGCVSLVPKTKPAHLYRFGDGIAAAPAPAGTVGVLRANAEFPREAAGDRILTVHAGKVAYLADTRWAAPASVLWDQAVLAAFDADPGPTRLVSRGEPARADYVLRLDVRAFEARYEKGPKAAPTVVIRVRAALTKGVARTLVSEQLFETRAPAAANRVSAIVPAFDKAVVDVLSQVVAWTNANATPG